MASFQTLLQERKYPFLFSFAVLLLCVSVLLFTNNRFSVLTADLENSQSIHEIQAAGRENSQPLQEIQDSNRSVSALSSEGGGGASDSNGDISSEQRQFDWQICSFGGAVDYIPCLDNWKAIKALPSRRHMEHRERHCPSPSLRCLVPLPKGYKVPVPWPKSRDMVWFDNVPHPKLVKYKKDQNWVTKSGDYLVFPGGGTQFKQGVDSYIGFIEGILPNIEWGKHTRVALDVGCGVASFGGYLLDKNVLTMSVAPKDEHEAQIQFALERGIPSMLSVIGTQRLTFPNNAFDIVHCARCRVHWDADGGKPLLELNRVLRPGGYFIWSATPVYRDDERDQGVWKAMVALTKSMCWEMVVKNVDTAGIGIVIYQKPTSNSCYEERKENDPPLCDEKNMAAISWYVPLNNCLPLIQYADTDVEKKWPNPWPERLSSRPFSLSGEPSSGITEKKFYVDSDRWATLVSGVYMQGLSINWSSIRNVMDMNAGYGGFAAALAGESLWVMNVVPVDGPNTLQIIFDRGMFGTYHDWCEAFNTYPRTYDLLHSSYLFENITRRCDIVDVAVEMDRILRPSGWVLIQDTMDMIQQLRPIFHSLHWDTSVHGKQFLVGRKGFWRPVNGGSET
ncbi:probable methyltransferase PMT23 [Aristolochia californica]|uniref:probable methyltransferase PMT23 n=1 Tax=Aristolochia californica TaxID=171875 RepID=UPI0035D5BEE6